MNMYVYPFIRGRSSTLYWIRCHARARNVINDTSKLIAVLKVYMFLIILLKIGIVSV